MSYSLTDREMASVNSVSDGRPQIVVELTRGAARTKKGKKKKKQISCWEMKKEREVSCLERKRKEKDYVVGRIRTCAGRPQWISSPSP